MTKTEKYQFNLIDKTDTFSPDPLNENMKKVETALEAESAAREEKAAELNMTIQKNQSAASSDLAAHAADITQHAFVKLGKFAIPAGQTVTLPIADPNIYNYIMSDVQVSGKSSAKFNVAPGGSSFGPISATSTSGTHCLHFLLPKGTSTSVGFHILLDIFATASNALTVFTGGPTWSKVQSISYGGCDADATVSVYALLA